VQLSRKSAASTIFCGEISWDRSTIVQSLWMERITPFKLAT